MLLRLCSLQKLDLTYLSFFSVLLYDTSQLKSVDVLGGGQEFSLLVVMSTQSQIIRKWLFSFPQI